jgi:aminopeptidase
VEGELLERYAQLIAGYGANIQPGQQVLVIASPAAAPLVRAIAAACYDRGAVFVDPWWFDPYVKRVRAQHADPETLEYAPPWYGRRILALSEAHGSRISISPNTPPRLLDGIDPAIAGRDQMPSLREHFPVINAKTTNWLVVPWAVPDWARVVHPGLDDAEAMRRLEEQLVYVLRLDEPDAVAAWQERIGELHDIGTRLDGAAFDALHFEGPGTDLTVGLLPTSHFAKDSPGTTTVDGVNHNPNLPTEEIFSSPDPTRTEGVVTATKPHDVSGVLVTGLRVRFEGGRAVSIEADQGADALRARCAKDENASRLGEVALVDGQGRIGKTNTVFFNTLLDENAASHLAFGNAYQSAVGPEDYDRINSSVIHIDFMIGGDEVSVTGVTRDGVRVPVLRGGVWKI